MFNTQKTQKHNSNHKYAAFFMNILHQLVMVLQQSVCSAVRDSHSDVLIMKAIVSQPMRGTAMCTRAKCLPH